ncbi:ppGpp synthetase catalytic domain-containing protein (RelA/SpoT-type nucleotidyltranferase) [Thermostaphylospora chromogena]|uniref:PpGpp synthetase catalytic domain-containing protein (RelA/SpoT-type nucleotidyltranferase) n=2 Tax=Thermostaphylospora chromogena TaxID=35622 RepID=A0A1H1BR18_9ACTN|nr:ppGpp synthetase catalytic domain-containing protein (RelA/SpoT-type nucleotidyltranferase) [Thermostaphylospora chromogena]
MSKRALDHLGERLAAHGRVTEEDAEEFTRAIDAYQEALLQVARYLNDLGYLASTRIKTTTVLIDKLRRESSRLSQVQDLAGARVVVADRREQDEAVARIGAFFDQRGGRPCRIKDRRANPSHGYRAVHVIVFVEDVPVEIQVRTELQDVWAQILERLGDHWGRGIRYGLDPENPEATIRTRGTLLTRRDTIRLLGKLSTAIDSLETQRVTLVNIWQLFNHQTRSTAEGLLAQLDRMERIEGRLLADIPTPTPFKDVTAGIYRTLLEHDGSLSSHVSALSLEYLSDVRTSLIEIIDLIARVLKNAQERADRLEAETRSALDLFAQAAEEMGVDP